MRAEPDPMMPVRFVSAADTADREVLVTWSDGSTSRFHNRWLRDNSPGALHPQTQHRVEETSRLDPLLKPDGVTVTADGALHVRWPDGHESTFGSAWLNVHDYSSGARWQPPQPELWDGSFADRVARISHAELLSDVGARIAWLRAFRANGVAILTGIEHREGIVAEIGEDLGRVRTTSWGRVFDVRSIENANSVAYTGLPLVLHTDEGYRDPAPTVQLQHFLVNDAGGGATTLVDGFKVAADLRSSDPAAFDLLVRTTMRFHFRDDDIELTAEGATIELDPRGNVRSVRYSNHSCQPFLVDPDEMDALYDAYTTFGAMREDPAYRIQIAMGAGEMYMVDNRRVMHGRTGLTSGGGRHLQSCYVEIDELLGRLAILERSVAVASV